MLGQHVGVAALALLYLLAIFGWGSLLQKLLSSERSPLDDVASRIIAGCGVLYVLFIGLSAAGVLHPLGVFIILGCGILLSAFFVGSVFKTPFNWTEWELADRVLLAVVAALGLLQLVFGLTPLTFYDLQVYHLLAPAQFLSSGSLTHIPWNVHTNSPLALQLVVGMSLALDGGGDLAKLLFVALGLLVPLGVFEFLRPAGRRAALLAALFTLSFPEFWLMQTLGVVDLSIAGLMIFAALWARRAILEQQRPDAIFAGIAFGIAVGSRYQAVVLTAWSLIAIIGENFIRGRRTLPARKTMLQVGLIGLLVTLLVCPWIIRNYVHTGNPVYPLMHDVWGSKEWSTEQASRLNREVLGPGVAELNGIQRTLAPVRALLNMPANGLFGMALLLGALAALAMKSRELTLTAVLGLGGLLVWSMIRPSGGAPLLRFNAAAIAFLLAATGAVLAHREFLANAGTRIAGVLAGGSLIIAVFHVSSLIPVAQSLTDPRARHAWQQDNVPSWAAFEYINKNLRPDRDKVLLIGEARGLWLRVPYIAPSAFNGPQLDAAFGSDPERWTAALVQRGITHLLISAPELERFQEQYGYFGLATHHAEEFRGWVQRLPHVFEDGRGTFVLALDASPDTLVRSK